MEQRHKAVTDGAVWFGADKTTLRAGVGTGSKAQADLWARALLLCVGLRMIITRG